MGNGSSIHYAVMDAEPHYFRFSGNSNGTYTVTGSLVSRTSIFSSSDLHGQVNPFR